MKKINHIFFNLTGLIILILCFGWLLYGDHHYQIHPLQENQNVHEKIQVRIDQIYNSIIAIRRDIHHMLFALHIVPIPYNQIAVKSKEMFAYRRITLNVKLNKSGNKEEIKNEIIEFIKKLDTLPGKNIFTIPLGDTDSGILNSNGRSQFTMIQILQKMPGK